MTKCERETLVHQARIMVRETAYNLAVLEVSDSGEAYSRACHLYCLACDLLHDVSESANASEFIRATYQPKYAYVHVTVDPAQGRE
jgi:hypothetical protein